jgi:hypothetical protein
MMAWAGRLRRSKVLRLGLMLLTTTPMHAEAMPVVVPDATGACAGSFDANQHDLRRCTELDGDLLVHSDLLYPLDSLRLLGGSLLISSSAVRSLHGLEGLMTVREAELVRRS